MAREISADRLERELERWFGHRRFRRLQRPIVGAMLEGRDVLGVLPTGGGKSLCYQLPALITPGLTLVVSPLISLMQDQVGALRRRGAAAADLTSATPPAARRYAEALVRAPGPRLLYVSPERLNSARFRGLCDGVRLSRLVVDEAHCISEWGHDFRPSYRCISSFFVPAGRPPVAAFTATATPSTRSDIELSLALSRPFRVLSTVDRPNLMWCVEQGATTTEAASRVAGAIRATLKKHRYGAAIVYVSTRARAVRTAELLRRLGVGADPYHGAMRDEVRARVQARFLSGDLRVVCATSAFGMGIDHPGIRLVAHLGMPASVEAYVQESGRAGRDGRPARCVLVTTPRDRRIHASLIEEQWSTRQEGGELPDGLSGDAGRQRALQRLRDMEAYVSNRGCRRAYIARYFGERPPHCAGCDRCARGGQRSGCVDRLLG